MNCAVDESGSILPLPRSGDTRTYVRIGIGAERIRREAEQIARE